MKNSNKYEQTQQARSNILNRLKRACNDKSGPMPQVRRSASVFPEPDDLLATFITEFERVSGQVYVCNNRQEVSQHLSQLLSQRQFTRIACRQADLRALLPDRSNVITESLPCDLEISITACEYLIARTGSIVVSSQQPSGRLLNVFPEVHVVIASKKQLVPFIDDALADLRQRYAGNWPSQISFITGPSRTADIEKTLVMGAHGPKELILLIHD